MNYEMNLLEDIREYIIKGLIIILLMIALVSVVKTFVQSSSVVNAETKRDLHCVSVCVDSNDTLWSLAEEYYSDEYNSIDNLIHEIKTINHMGSDQVNVGNYIIIPYYK